MRMLAFASRNVKEIIRDPLDVVFGIGFPVILLLLLSAIQANIPVDMFRIEHLTPGVTVFGLSFMSLFSALIISKDRQSLFLQRLYTTPLTPVDFILGYTLPILPLALLQSVVCYVVASFLGLSLSINILWALLLILPVSLLYIAIGLLCGSVFSDKQVGGICGALLTNLSAWVSGIWFDIELLGGVFGKIANLLPFIHAVELERMALSGTLSEGIHHLLWVLSWAFILLAAAVFAFLRQMKKQ